MTRKRLGTIRFVDPQGQYGFIDAEDFREDVFFHHTVWQPPGTKQAGPLAGRGDASPGKGSGDRRPGGGPRRDGRRQPAPTLNPQDLVGRHVEFEIDDELFESEKRLRATVVTTTRRPMGRRLTGRDATFKVVTHHPKARRKRPDWRS